MKNSEYWIEGLSLKKHPEGGWFSEIYRSSTLISASALRDNFRQDRNLATSIYFLLDKTEVSVFHRLQSDELWYYHYGSPVLIHCFDNEHNYTSVILGPELDQKQALQITVPAGTIFGAEVLYPEEYSLIGCMVTPGFHYDDFEIVPKQFLLETYPAQKDIIDKLT